jgi:hypothetical protein
MSFGKHKINIEKISILIFSKCGGQNKLKRSQDSLANMANLPILPGSQCGSTRQDW